MGTVEQKLQAIVDSKNAIKQALINKGRTPSDVLSTYAGEIDNIVLGAPNLCGDLTFGGTYASATYFTEAGCSMGYNDKGEVFVIIQGGTSSSYENIVFYLGSAPQGVTLASTSPYGGVNGTPLQTHYGCKLQGVAQKVNIAINFDSVNSSYDYVRANMTVTYV